MTTKEMIIDVYEALGEPTDLAPYTDVNDPINTFDITTDGAVKLLRWVNEGYRRLIAYKFPNGTMMRFPELESYVNFKTYTESDTAQAGATTTITLAAGASAVDDFYNDWVVEIDSGTGANQIRTIMDYNGTTKVAIANRDYDTDPDATSVYSLYKNFMDIVSSTDAKAAVSIVLDPVNVFFGANKLTDMNNKRLIVKGFRTDTFVNQLESKGIPDVYRVRGYKLFFNQNVDEQRWFHLEYTRLPDDMTLATDEPAIPSNFHEVIAMFAHWKGLKRSGESDTKWAIRQDIDHYMKTNFQPIEIEMERENGQAVVDFERGLYGGRY